jgi:glyoxylase I family protein
VSAGARWSHVALNCADQATTAEFYTRWFGFTVAREVPLGDDRIVFLRSGAAYLELFGASGSAAGNVKDGPTGPGVPRHLAFQTDDLDGFLAGLDPEVPVSLGPIDFSDVLPGWRSAWLLDPDGVVVEVSQGFRDQHPDELEETRR